MKNLLILAAVAASFAVAGAANATRYLHIITSATDDVPGYASYVADLNEAWAAADIPAEGRVYMPGVAGDATGVAYFVAFFDSAADWEAMASSTTENEAVMEILARSEPVREMINSTLYVALRDGGTHDNDVVYSVFVTTTDLPAYLAAIDELDQLMSDNGLDDAKISVYQPIAAGQAQALQVVVSLPSTERVPVLMEAMTSDWFGDFMTRTRPIRTIVSNGLFPSVPVE